MTVAIAEHLLQRDLLWLLDAGASRGAPAAHRPLHLTSGPADPHAVGPDGVFLPFAERTVDPCA